MKKKRKKSFHEMAEAVADVADEMALTGSAVVADPQLLKRAGIKRKHVSVALGPAADRINKQRLRDLIERLRADGWQVNEPPNTDVPPPPKRVGGLTIPQLIYWMGHDAWDLEETQVALTKLGATVDDETATEMLQLGRKNERPVPTLSEGTIEQLYKLIGQS